MVATLLIQTWDYFLGCFLREDCTLNVDQIHSWQNNLGQKTRSQSLPSHWIMYNRCMCNICKVFNTFLACLASRRIEINLYSTTTFSIFLFQKCNIPLTCFDFRTLHWQINFFFLTFCVTTMSAWANHSAATGFHDATKHCGPRNETVHANPTKICSRVTCSKSRHSRSPPPTPPHRHSSKVTN